MRRPGLFFVILTTVILGRTSMCVTQVDNKVIAENTLWSGEIVVSGVAVVERNAVLTIAAGAVIKFISPDGALNVKGTLLANGIHEQKIIFTSRGENAGWEGIVFSGEKQEDAANKLSNCIVKLAKIGVRCSEMAAVNIENCSFAKNGLAVVFAQSANGIISHSEFIENINGGIFSEQARLQISNNNFVDNNNFAVNCIRGSEAIISENVIAKHRSGIIFSFVGTKGQIKNNIIKENEYGIFTEKLAELDVSNNTLKENGYGIYIRQGSKPIIFMNEITGNRIGIFMTEIFNLAINRNNIYENKEYEIGLDKVSNDTAVSRPPNAKGKLTKDDVLFCEYIDARENFWGGEITKEMREKGVSANISKILDFYDNPAFNIDDKNFKTKYILYSEWKEKAVEGAGAKTFE